MRLTQPILNRGRLVHVAWKLVRFARPNDGLDDVPDGILVCVSCGPDQHARSLPRVLVNADGLPDRIGRAVLNRDLDSLSFRAAVGRLSRVDNNSWFS